MFLPAVDGVLRLVENPSGRAPRATLVAAAEWYRGLDEQEREHCRYLVEEAARQTVFGLLAVVDEARTFDGALRLVHVGADGSEAIYGGQSDLHDEWQGLLPPR